MKKITEDDLFDAIADEISGKFPQPGEETVEMFAERMRKRGKILTMDQAGYWLDELVKQGKLTRRPGIVGGRKGRIYKRK